MSTDPEAQAVRVHVVADSTPRRPRGRKTRGTYGTYLLTAAIPAQQILPPVGAEREAVVMAVDTAIVLADTLAAAQGGYGTYVPAGAQWVIRDEGNVYAGATGLTGSTTARVSVSTIMTEVP